MVIADSSLAREEWTFVKPGLLEELTPAAAPSEPMVFRRHAHDAEVRMPRGEVALEERMGDLGFVVDIVAALILVAVDDPSNKLRSLCSGGNVGDRE